MQPTLGNNFGFEDLELWKKIRLFKKNVCAVANLFPPSEKYRLTDQLKRSARSINANIAEGHGRFTYPDQLHFCVIARGSLSETINHLIDALDEGYITEEILLTTKSSGKEIEKFLNGYITFLRKKRDEVKVK